jgi:hypothetical protein
MKMISRCGFAFLLTAALLIPGISSAATVTGETTVPVGTLGDITLEMTVEDIITEITITWPENRWVGITFGPDDSHDGSYGIQSSLDGTDVFEINQQTRTRPPIRQTEQNILSVDFTTGGGISQLTVTRLSDTGDPFDDVFTAVPQVLEVQYALGFIGGPVIEQHEVRGYFPTITLVPVPAALPLLASGLFTLGLFARRKKSLDQ